MSTDVRKRWKPLDSGNAISALLAAARLPCHRPVLPSRPAARAPAVRGCTAEPPPAALGAPTQPRHSPNTAPRIPLAAGWALSPAHSAGRGEQPLRCCGHTACPRQRCRFPVGRRCHLREALAGGAVPSCPVPSRGGAGSPALGNCVPCPRAAWWVAAGRGALGRGRCGRKGKRRAPAPTQSHHTPPPRCGFAAAT